MKKFNRKRFVVGLGTALALVLVLALVISASVFLTKKIWIKKSMRRVIPHGLS